MKSYIVFVACLAVVNAIAWDQAGVSKQSRNQDLHGYNFGYTEAHPSGGSARAEKGDVWGNKVGSYSLQDADGRVRRVDYVADKLGFRAKVSTNEPGTQSGTPAAVLVHSSAPLAAKVLAGGPVGLVGAPLGHAGLIGAPAYGAPVLAAPALGLAHGGLGLGLGVGLGGLGALGAYGAY